MNLSAQLGQPGQAPIVERDGRPTSQFAQFLASANSVLQSGLTNSRISKNSAYIVQDADGGSTIALGGNAFYTLTFNSASNYKANFFVLVLNEDTGRAKTIALSGGVNFLLYPGQNIAVFNQNNVWNILGKSRWRLPNSITIFVNSSLGNDVNDGLSSGAGNAKATVQAALNQIVADFDYQGIPGNVVTVQMGANDTTGVHFGPQGLVGGLSGGNITLDGGGFSISVAGDTDTPVHLFFGALMYIQNLTIITGTNHPGLICERGAKAFLKSGNVFAAGGAASVHIQLLDGGSLEADNNYSISGGTGFHIVCSDGGVYRTPGAPTISFTASVTFITFVLATNCAVADFQTASISLGGNTVTGKRWEADNNAVVQSATGAPNTFFPGNVNGTTSAGGQGV